MAQRLCSFLVVFLLMFSGGIFGQEKPEKDTFLIFKPDCRGCFINNLFQKTSQLRDCIKRPINYEKLANLDFENQLKLDYKPNDTAGIKKPLSPFILFKPVALPS